MQVTVEPTGVMVGFSDWTKSRTVQAIGTNAGAPTLAFQAWRHFKEAFAPEFVEQAVIETQEAAGRRLISLLDPFGGSGTSALAAQFLGVKPTIIEVNPFLADLIEAKVAAYDFDDASYWFGRVVDLVAQFAASVVPFPGAPSTFVEPGVKGRFIFSTQVAQRLAAYRDAIDAVDNPIVRRLFRVILASTAIPASNVVVSGKGRRYRRGEASGNKDARLVDRLFAQGVLAALFDLRRYENRHCRDYELLRGDARLLTSSIDKVDLAVFSPPYPNSFDYTDVYNVELWVLGYLTDRVSNRALREATLRSHVQIKRDMSAEESNSPTLRHSVDKLKRLRSSLWNKYIPEMIEAYADDMRIVLRAIYARLRSGGRVYMAVGDSQYAGIEVPVAKILVEEAPFLGFKIVRAEPFRSMRASPQQGGRTELYETLIVLTT